MGNKELLRRPISARDTKWAAAVARWLGRIGLRPNQISMLSILCAALAGASLLFSGRMAGARPAFLIGAAAFIQLRLLCNLFDGMVAVEGGFKTKSGEIYNELPDRFSDALIFVGAGYSISALAWGRELGWIAALLAVITAYVRALGGAAGAAQYFCGPMAKQQRMAVMTAACVVAALMAAMNWTLPIIPLALGIVVVGAVFTIFRRTILIMKDLESK
ncbi:MAG: CDP-alcohol phosphatidyltransferase [Pedosphaera sp.]|nr:CDP-alcohol phosphatidyltransferase [Pedosphaera sp.]